MARKVGERNKDIILKLIAENNNELTTNDLVEKTGFHRDTVYVNCKELIDRGYINKSGKYGKYYLTLKAFNKPNLRGLNLAKEITKIMRMYGISFITLDQLNIIADKIKDISELKDIQKELLTFSLSIGSYITYIFLQSLNPDEWIFSSLTDNKQKWVKGMDALSEQEKDEVIRSWVKSAINPLYLLMQFKRLNIIKRHDFDRLIKSYEKIFPDLFKQFEDINKKMNEPQKERTEEEIYDEATTGYYESLDRRNNKNKIKSN